MITKLKRKAHIPLLSIIDLAVWAKEKIDNQPMVEVQRVGKGKNKVSLIEEIRFG